MEFLASAIGNLSIAQQVRTRDRLGRKRVYHDDSKDKEYISKNLDTERRRRAKLSSRLLALRAIVPIITNMTKATIIEDAITYIQELKKNVDLLTDQLVEMAGPSEEAIKARSHEIDDPAHQMKQCGITEDVQVTYVGENKVWIKIILERRRGRFTKLIEAMAYLGLELVDTSVTSYKGAILFSSCVEGTDGDRLTVEQTKEFLVEIIRSI